MPEPDPHAITLGEARPGQYALLVDTGFFGNRKARMARARAILRRMMRHDWQCLWCKAPLPLFRRADARFCCEGCRKRGGAATARVI